MSRRGLAICALAMVCSSDLVAQVVVPEIGSDSWRAHPSGIEYAQVRSGSSACLPKRGDFVSMHLSAWRRDTGALVATTKDRKPVRIRLGKTEVAPAVEIAARLMTPSSRFLFRVPAELAADPRDTLPDDLDMLYDLELVGYETGARPHAFVAARAEWRVDLAEGLAYEVLSRGRGRRCVESDRVTLRYSVFTSEGSLILSTAFGSPVSARVKELWLPVLRYVPLCMHEGGVVRVDTTDRYGLRGVDEERQVWIVELADIVEPRLPPKFVAPPVDESSPVEGRSGWRWRQLEAGAGDRPTPGSAVTVEYAVRSSDGSRVVDGSFGSGESVLWHLRSVAPVWARTLPEMQPGETRVVTAPTGDFRPPDSPSGPGPGDDRLVGWVRLVRLGW